MHTLHLYQFIFVLGNPKNISYYHNSETKQNIFYFSQISDFKIIDTRSTDNIEYGLIKITHSLREHIIALEASTIKKIKTNVEAALSNDSAITNWDTMSSKIKTAILNDLIRNYKEIQPFSSDDNPLAFSSIS